MATNEANPAFQCQLRDWFAGMAMQGILTRQDAGVVYLDSRRLLRCSHTGSDDRGHSTLMADQLARVSLEIADAMMKQREAAR